MKCLTRTRAANRKAICRQGIDALTLNAVMKLFADPTVRHTAETVAQALTISRTTSRRYLEYCASRHLIIAEIIHGKVGRPQRIYHGG
ncbi:transcriptional regulator CriR [Salmonella bongori]|nr:transcriptional regulator CriR [Salmonella bongori]